MTKKLLLIFAIIFSQITVFANTGWSGKLTGEESLDELVIQKIESLYISNCLQLGNKSFSLRPIVEVSRINDEFDYFGSYAPTYNVDIKVYDPKVSDYVAQHLIVEVIYNQLSQDLSIKILDGAQLECHN